MGKEENLEIELKDYELFEYAIDRFTLEIDSLAESLPLVMGLVEFKFKNHSKKLDKFIDEHEDKDENGEKLYRIPLDKFDEFIKAKARNLIAKLMKQTIASHYIKNIFTNVNSKIIRIFIHI